MRPHAPLRITDPDACVEAVLDGVGRRLVMGLPVGIGKPNELANAFVRRAAADPAIHLTIVTALSLRAPRWSSDLERRYVEPLVRRLFGGYLELEYVRMLEERRLPSNIEVSPHAGARSSALRIPDRSLLNAVCWLTSLSNVKNAASSSA